MHRQTLIFVLLIAAAIAPHTTAQEPDEPLDTDLQEEVEVRFVILDALVLDRRGRVITDLKAEDFVLHLDFEPHPVTSVDIDCPKGSAAEPKAIKTGKKRPKQVAPAVPRRIVLAIDYKNLPHTRRIEVIDNLQELVRDNQAERDEIMVAAITRRLRIEQPFTTDRAVVIAALERMKNDPSLWMEQPLPHPHEFYLFDGMIDLIRMLREYEGRKAIVLFSELPSKIEDAPFRRPLSVTPPAFDYDRKFETIAAAATDARVAVYTAHATGLGHRRSSDRLSRMALETGGRFTRYTNDLSLAYARAQRDLICRYAVGFYDNDPELDKVHHVNLKVKRPWARVLHPRHYRFGFDDVARESLTETVYTAPIMYQAGSVKADLLPVRPLSSGEWEAAVVISFSASIPAAGENTVRFGVKLDDYAMRAVHTYDGSLTLMDGGADSAQKVVVIEPAYIAPGEYMLSVAVNDPEAAGPQAAVEQAVLPVLPKKGLYLPAPLLFQRAAEHVAIDWVAGFTLVEWDDQSPAALAPVPDGGAALPGRIVAVTHLCRLGAGRRKMVGRLERELRNRKGEVIRQLPVREIVPEGEAANPCRQVQDELDLTDLVPGDYEFVARISGTSDRASQERSASFRLGGSENDRSSGR
jgi:VWFA-related protein